jgi:glycosyltransferase involved in cell wall biosynthesis
MHPGAGGPPIVVERLSERLRERGHGVRIVTTALLCDDDGQELQKSLEKSMDVAVLPINRPRFAGLASSAPRVVDHAVGEADLVHLHGLWHPLNTLGRRACARHGRPYVMMPHGMLDPYSLGIKAIRKRLYLKFREESLLRNAARVIFTSSEEQTLARVTLPWLAGDVVPLGADEPPALKDRRDLEQLLRSRFPVLEGRRIILFLGRVHPKKGLEHLLDALPQVLLRHPDVTLVVAGPGEPAYLERLKVIVRRKGLQPKVLFTGMLVGLSKWAALSSAELLTLPSYQENFGVAVVEAMKCGLPVVVSDRVNIWREIADAGAGRVVTADELPAQLAAVLIELLSDVAGAMAMGRKGRALADESYTWDKTADRMLAVYDGIVGAA